MPQDLFGGNPNFGVQQQDNAPRDLFNGNPNFGAENVPQGTSNPEDSRGFWNNFARHRAANIGGALQNVAKDVGAAAFPQAASLIKGMPGAGEGQNIDFYKGLGVQKGLPDEIIQGAMEQAPFVIGANGIAKGISEIPQAANMFAKFAQAAPKTAKVSGEIAKNVIAGDAYSLDKGNDNLGTSTLLSAASVPLGYAVTAPLQYAAKKIAQSSIPGLTQRATDYLKNLSSPQEYAQQYKNIYQTAANENKANWNNLDEAAAKLDASLGNKPSYPPNSPNMLGSDSASPKLPGASQGNAAFDNTPYMNYIDDFVNKINKLEPAQREQYSQALDVAQKAKELAPQSISGSVAAYKNLNQNLKDYLSQKGIPAANMQAKQFIAGLKDNIKQNMSNDFLDNQMKSLGYDSSFTDLWNKANQSHQALQEFYKAPDSLGRLRANRSLKEALQSNGDVDAAIIGKYMPKPSQTGTDGLDQLAKNMDSSQNAQDAAKAYLNRRPLNNGNTVLDASTEYAKLSPAQRQAIYGNSTEGNLLGAVNDVRTAFGKEPERSFYKMFSHPAASMVAAPILGGAAGYYAGDEKGAMAGAAIPLIASAIARKSAGRLSPESVRGLIRYAQTAPKNVGRNINVLLQSLYQGGQQ